MITDDEPRSIREINPDIPEWLCLLISRLMAKSPDARFGNALEVATLLEQCLAHVQQPTSVPLSASLVTHAAGRRSIFTVTRKGVLAMLGTIGMTLLGMVLWKATEAPDISGQWTSDEWGTVVLEAKQPGQYEGTFTGKSGAVDPKFHGKLQSLKTGDGIAQFHIPDVDLTDVLDKSKSGTLRVKWSRVERRFNGTWGSSNDRTKVTVTPEGAIIGYKDTRGSGADRSAKISLRLVDKEIRGGWTTDEDAQLESGTPRLGDLLWKRSSENTAKDAVPSNGKSLQGKIRRVDQKRKLAWINLGTADGVTPGMTFEVRQNAAEYAEGRSPTKGSVEVIRLLDQHMSEVQILKEDLQDKFTEDDDVFSFIIDPKSLAAAVKRFNSGTTEVRSKLFAPPIPDLTVERLREGFRQSATYLKSFGLGSRLR